MSYVTWKIYHTQWGDRTWDTSTRQEITEFRDPQITVSLGDSKDSFSFKVVNNYGKYDDFFGPKDKVEIYRAVNSDTVTDSDLLMIGTITANPVTQKYNSKILQIKGNNFSKNTMEAIAFFDVDGLTVPNALQRGIDSVGGFNENFGVTWKDTNPTTQQDGSAFPTVQEQWYWKPLRKFIQKYSTTQETEDGDYYWYINNNNEFIWKPSKDFGSDTFNDSTDGYKSLTTKKDLEGIRNLIVCQGGLDPAGKPIQTPYFAHSSIASVGIKFHVLISEKNNAADLVELDKSDDNQDSTYPDDIVDGNSFTTNWKSNYTYTTSEYGINVTKGSTITINEGGSNKEAYVEVIRTETKKRLLAEAKSFVNNRLYGIFQTDIELNPNQKSWGLGDEITVSIQQFKEGKETPLRVNEIRHTTTSDIYTLEEDEGTVGKD